MSSCNLKVELHGATRDHYVRLHENLQRHGITNQTVSNDNRRWILPPAEYNYLGDLTRDQVLAVAKQCAAAVGLRFAIVVSEYVGCTWDGLQPAA